jgi:cell division protein FtsZ
LVAQIGQESGALVLAVATLPFAFEGKRRSAQAMEALQAFNRVADAVICFENDRMGDMVLPKAGIHQAFAMADTTISQSVRAIVNVVRRPGLIRIGFDELLSALRSQNSRCLFGFGESDSDNRAHEALALALKNPLMNRGKMLTEAQSVLVHITGGPGMTLTEVEIVMQDLNRHVEDHTQILFGTSVDGKMGERLSVTLISSLSAESSAQVAPLRTVRISEPEEKPKRAPHVVEAEQEIEPPIAPDVLEFAADEPVAPPMPEETVAMEEPPPPPAPVKKERKPVVRREPPPIPEIPELIPPASSPGKKEKPHQPRQEVMQFEPVTRGRFEKSEPTIEEGQDLDVPTFLRKNARVK